MCSYALLILFDVTLRAMCGRMVRCGKTNKAYHGFHSLYLHILQHSLSFLLKLVLQIRKKNKSCRCQMNETGDHLLSTKIINPQGKYPF